MVGAFVREIHFFMPALVVCSRRRKMQTGFVLGSTVSSLDRGRITAAMHAFLLAATETACVARALGLRGCEDGGSADDDEITCSDLKHAIQFQVTSDTGNYLEPCMCAVLGLTENPSQPQLPPEAQDVMQAISETMELADFFTSMNLQHVYRAHVVALATQQRRPRHVLRFLQKWRGRSKEEMTRAFYAYLDDEAEDEDAEDEDAEDEDEDAEIEDAEIEEAGDEDAGDEDAEDEDAEDEDAEIEDAEGEDTDDEETDDEDHTFVREFTEAWRTTPERYATQIATASPLLQLINQSLQAAF